MFKGIIKLKISNVILCKLYILTGDKKRKSRDGVIPSACCPVTSLFILNYKCWVMRIHVTLLSSEQEIDLLCHVELPVSSQERGTGQETLLDVICLVNSWYVPNVENRNKLFQSQHCSRFRKNGILPINEKCKAGAIHWMITANQCCFPMTFAHR